MLIEFVTIFLLLMFGGFSVRHVGPWCVNHGSTPTLSVLEGEVLTTSPLGHQGSHNAPVWKKASSYCVLTWPFLCLSLPLSLHSAVCVHVCVWRERGLWCLSLL